MAADNRRDTYSLLLEPEIGPDFPTSESHKEFDMARPITLCTGQWADLPVEELARKCSEFGFDGLELAWWRESMMSSTA